MTKKKSNRKGKKKKVTSEELAYLAGLFDTKVTLRCKMEKFVGKGIAIFDFTSSDKELLDWIGSRIGFGRVYEGVKYGNHECSRLVLKNEEVVSVLHLLYPFLRIQRGQVGTLLRLLKLIDDADFDIDKADLGLGKMLIQHLKQGGSKPVIRSNITVQGSKHRTTAEKFKTTPLIKQLYESEKKVQGISRCSELEESSMKFLADNSNPYNKYVTVKIFKVKGKDLLLTDTSAFCKECFRNDRCTKSCDFTIGQSRNLLSRFDAGYFCCFEVDIDKVGKLMFAVNKRKGKKPKRFPGVWYYKSGSQMSPLFVLGRCKQPVNRVFNKFLVPRLGTIGSLIMYPGFINKPNLTLTEKMNINVFGMYKRLGIDFEFPVQHKLVFCGIVMSYIPTAV